MGKIKSAICLVLATLIIAALSFICFVSFPIGGGQVSQFDAVVTWVNKDADLGVEYGANDSYRGGGYSATYYPEGIIATREFEENRDAKTGKDREDYEARYTSIGALCVETEKITVTNGQIADEEFISKFNYAKEQIGARYAAMHIDGFRLDVVDGYTLRAFVPQAEEQSNAYTALFALFGYMGDLEIYYGASEEEATPFLPARASENIGKYISGASVLSDASGTNVVAVSLTSEGEEKFAAKTADVTDSGTGTIVFRMGEDTIFPLSISEPVSNDVIYVSGGTGNPFSSAAAHGLAVLLDQAAHAEGSAADVYSGTFTVSYDNVVSERALFGDDALMYLYIAFGICFVGMMVFFFVRYGLLGFVHLYTYMFFLLVTLLCMWSISFVTISTGTYAAVLIASLLLSASQAIVYENARKEYKTGKTIAASVKNAYKKCFWHIFDAHIIVAGVSFITYAIALTKLSGFAFMLGLCTIFSGICALALGRFFWAIMMSFTKKKANFCNFKREEVEEND